MPRPHKPRWVGLQHSGVSFVPQAGGFSMPDSVLLGLDELEALRLADLNGMSQEQAASLMNVSRATFGRIVARARAKVADALIHSRSITVEGGVVRFMPPQGRGRGGPGPRGGGQGPRGGGQGPHGGGQGRHGRGGQWR